MKKTITKIGIVMLLAITATTFNSCKKAKIKGCTSSQATNFKSDAEEDDGSCSYSGEMVFWYDQTAANMLSSAGVTGIYYYVDGSLGGSSANVYYSSAPSCGGNGTVTVSKTWKGGTSSGSSYSVKDQTGTVIGSGSVTFNANTCTKLQLQ